jgi:thiol-disulfide isomerase/thioredoxin
MAAGSSLAQTAASPGSPYGYDLRGRPVTRLESAGTRAVVLFFVATDCPISNRYAPEIQRLQQEFAGKPVAFWIVYPNATETESGILHHQAAFGLGGGATLMRPREALMTLAQPNVTPESVVLVPEKSGLRAAYVGRIDDRYVAFGKERPQAGRHDLEAAILAVLDHRMPQPPGGPPVGCGIVSEAALHPGAGQR